jgi:membrane-associated phospholipid phosphatase
VLNAAWIVAVAMTLKTAPVPPPQAPAPTEWTDDRPIARLPQNLGHDIVKLPRLQSAAVAGAGLMAVGMTHGSDQSVADWARGSGSSSYSEIGSTLGDEWFQGGSAIGTYALGRLTHKPTVTHIGSDLIRAQMLNGVLTTGLKIAVERTRPNGGPRAFPSGHSSATFASAAVLSDHFGWKVAIPAYAAASFVSLTRVRDNQHWLSDVVFGGAVGVITGRTITSTHRHSGWVVAPAVTRGGAGVYFVRR